MTYSGSSDQTTNVPEPCSFLLPLRLWNQAVLKGTVFQAVVDASLPIAQRAFEQHERRRPIAAKGGLTVRLIDEERPRPAEWIGGAFRQSPHFRGRHPVQCRQCLRKRVRRL